MGFATAKIVIRAAGRGILPPLGEVWAYKELFYFMVWRDTKVRYKQTVLGAAWVILQPLVSMLIFTVIFGIFAGLPSEGIPYPLFTLTALLPWQFFAASLNQSANSMVANEKLITKIYFPRLIIPLGTMAASLIDFGIAFALLLGMLLFYRVHPGGAILFLPLFIGLAIMTTVGAGLWLAALNVRFRDVRYTVPFLTQIWFFLTPIAYSVTLVPEKFKVLYFCNPLVGVVEGFRWTLLDKSIPDMALLALSAFSGSVICISGVIYFLKVEDDFADII